MGEEVYWNMWRVISFTTFIIMLTLLKWLGAFIVQVLVAKEVYKRLSGKGKRLLLTFFHHRNNNGETGLSDLEEGEGVGVHTTNREQHQAMEPPAQYTTEKIG